MTKAINLWKINRTASAFGEQPGQESIVGFRGTRFSISKKDRLYLTDYQREVGFAIDSKVKEYCVSARNILGPSWKNARIRIRANGDTYASSNPFSLYVGKTDCGSEEVFPGYLLLKDSYNLHTGKNRGSMRLN